MLLNPAARQAMGRAAQELVESSYTWDRITTMTEEAYREHLENLRA
jgi:glycosyltransferase involved in cell wall biosynthesis